MLWHELSWTQIDQLDRQLAIVIPLGSLEQHGHHLPVAVDTLQVTAVAEGLHQKVGDQLLMLPTLWLGCSHHHLDFPGTISVKPSLYAEMIKSMVRSILQAGFQRIFLLNGHGGNEIPAAQALTELIAEDDLADSAWLTFASWWHAAKSGVLPDRHGMSTAAISHACEYETSLMLAIRPDLVAQSKAVDLPPGFQSEWLEGTHGNIVQAFRRFHRLTSTGSMGQPSAASPEKGRTLLDAVVNDIAAFIQEFRRWPELPILKPYQT